MTGQTTDALQQPGHKMAASTVTDIMRRTCWAAALTTWESPGVYSVPQTVSWY